MMAHEVLESARKQVDAYFWPRFPTAMGLLKVWSLPPDSPELEKALQKCNARLVSQANRGFDVLGVGVVAGGPGMPWALVGALLCVWDTPRDARTYRTVYATAQGWLAKSLICDDTLVL